MRQRVTRSFRTTAASAAATTTLVSRTAATLAADARESAARTHAYATNVARPPTTGAGLNAARTAAIDRTRTMMPAYARLGRAIDSSRYGIGDACRIPCLSIRV